MNPLIEIHQVQNLQVISECVKLCLWMPYPSGNAQQRVSELLMQHFQSLQQISCGCLHDGFPGYICRSDLSELWVAFQAFQCTPKRSSNPGNTGQDGGEIKDKKICLETPKSL